MFHADHPFLIVLVGAFNTGKSSLINALLGASVLGVGPTPTTDRIVIVRHGDTLQRTIAGQVDTIFYPAPLLEQASLVDTPGLESVLTSHDDVTRRFLHRADQVWLVMLATQAMSQRSVESLRGLREYGKRVVLIVNQIDLIEPDERETIRAFVAQQAKANLETEPELWLVSAKWAAQAQQNVQRTGSQTATRDEALWEQSGFAAIERYLLRTLDDATRVRQKLETPLQTFARVLDAAQAQVREQQNTLAAYRQIAKNVQMQIEQAARDQHATVQQTLDQIDSAFTESEQRGGQAIRSTFALSRAPSLLGSGISALSGLARVRRLLGARGATRIAFDAKQVGEPLNAIPAIADNLPSRLEGRDLKDVDDLSAYARREMDKLPAVLKQKLVGQDRPPSSYDRVSMTEAHAQWLAVLDNARNAEPVRIDRAAQQTLIVLVFYELAVLIVGIAIGLGLAHSTSGGTWVTLVLLTLLALVAGVAAMPLRGLLLAQAYAQHLETVKAEVDAILRRAADRQIAFGVQMRQDAVGPFLRLIQAQTSSTDTLSDALERHKQTLTTLEKDLAALR